MKEIPKPLLEELERHFEKLIPLRRDIEYKLAIYATGSRLLLQQYKKTSNLEKYYEVKIGMKTMLETFHEIEDEWKKKIEEIEKNEP